MAAILDFAHNGHQGGHYSLYAVVFEINIPIPNTVPNCRNLSLSAQFS